MVRRAIIPVIAVATIAIGFAIAYFGLFRGSVRTIDSCSTPTRDYYLAPQILTDRFAYGDFRDPEYDPSIPLSVCLCHNNDKAGYEKPINETTTDQIFNQICQGSAPSPYFQRPL